MILTWFLGLWSNPMARKIIIYVAAGLVICLCLRWYGNAQWAKGVAYGDNRTQERMEKEYKSRWADAQKVIETEKRKYQEGVTKNETDRKLLTARAEELGRARTAIAAALERVVATAEASTAAGYQSARDVPDTELVNAIRELSSRLERERIASGPAH